MSRNGLTVIDCDVHYLDVVGLLGEYMPEPYRTIVTKSPNPSRLLPNSLGDRTLSGRIQRHDVAYQQGSEGGRQDPSEIPTVMERLGLDATIQISSQLSLLGSLSVRDLAGAFCNAFIDYMLDKVVDPAKGIYTVAVVPWQDPEEGAKIIERVGGHPGVVGVCFMTSGANPPLGDVRYNPIYERADHYKLPIVMHSDPALTLIEGGSYVDGLQRVIEAHSLGFVFSNMIQLTSVLMQGLPERFPDLRFVFLEAGLFYIPMMMFRLDEYFLKRRSEAPLLKGLPSEYVRDRMYFGTQPIEAPRQQGYLKSVFDACNGYETFLFASDYPHFDYDDPVAILNLSFLERQQMASVLGDNARRVFNFRKGGVQPWENTSSATSKTFQTTEHR